MIPKNEIKPFWDLPDPQNRYFEILCLHLDGIEAIDTIMLTIMAGLIDMIRITVATIRADEQADIARTSEDTVGAWNSNLYFSTLRDSYKNLLDYGDSFYLSRDEVAIIIERCRIVIPGPYKTFLIKHT